MEILKEGLANFYAEIGIPSRKLPVFYNPDMNLNRDVCVAIINLVKPKSVCCALAGTGIRALRILKETNTKKVIINDMKKEAYELIKKNLGLNNLNADVYNEDCNELLKRLKKLGCVIIDPFGSPLPFVEAAIKALNADGLLAISATDLGPLVGRYPKKCEKKYSANPLNNEFSKELGLRILIRKIQEIGLNNKKNFLPIYSFYYQHFFSAYFKTTKKNVKKDWGFVLYCPKCLNRKISKTKTGEKCACGNNFVQGGPMWLGSLWDKKLSQKISIIKYVKEENEVKAIGFFDLHQISRTYKKDIPKISEAISKLKEKGFQASRTHFSPTSIRTNANIKDFLD
ncbi:hypothetical protein HY643_01115 [Candidatus Woesearchaeota archaeon]|nr:hypothetical protein [Candidatus Woesearchaeota archaeon]